MLFSSKSKKKTAQFLQNGFINKRKSASVESDPVLPLCFMTVTLFISGTLITCQMKKKQWLMVVYIEKRAREKEVEINRFLGLPVSIGNM